MARFAGRVSSMVTGRQPVDGQESRQHGFAIRTGSHWGPSPHGGRSVSDGRSLQVLRGQVPYPEVSVLVSCCETFLKNLPFSSPLLPAAVDQNLLEPYGRLSTPTKPQSAAGEVAPTDGRGDSDHRQSAACGRSKYPQGRSGHPPGGILARPERSGHMVVYRALPRQSAKGCGRAGDCLPPQ